MSRDEEIQLGGEASPELVKEFGGKVQSPELQAYVTDIGRRLAPRPQSAQLGVSGGPAIEIVNHPVVAHEPVDVRAARLLAVAARLADPLRFD